MAKQKNTQQTTISMTKLFEMMGQLEEMVEELNNAPLFSKAAIGMRVAEKSWELTRLSFQKMEEFEKRLEIVEKRG